MIILSTILRSGRHASNSSRFLGPPRALMMISGVSVSSVKVDVEISSSSSASSK